MGLPGISTPIDPSPRSQSVGPTLQTTIPVFGDFINGAATFAKDRFPGPPGRP